MAVPSIDDFVFGEQLSSADMNAILDDLGTLYNGGVAADSLTYDKIDSAAWDTFTPSWTNVTVGTGATNTGHYIKLGKLVIFWVRLTLGTSPSVGSGVSFTAPFNLHAGYNVSQRQTIGTASADDANGNGWPGITMPFSSSLLGARFINTGSGGIHSGITSTFPFTWVATDSLFLQGAYEAA